ncbi:tRNA_anti-like [Burkholderia sp. WP9]|uniref:OB-fold protein n=1 Tax=Burkholderia sp. WP9 TaxID=1500263 RepID=UPI0008944FD1|nr:hypothetical protein [Burkholderia sp. WP9]SEC86757.1 tRNA_anti-like [Burkholderia sp. WP9]
MRLTVLLATALFATSAHAGTITDEVTAPDNHELATVAAVTAGIYRYDLSEFTCARNAQLQNEGATTERDRKYGRWLTNIAAAHPSAKTMRVRSNGTFDGGGCYERIAGGIRIYRPYTMQPVGIVAPVVPGDPDAAELPQTANAAAPQQTQPIQITAQQLYAEYHANEVAADLKYKGRWLAVTGAVVEIKNDVFGQPVVSLQVDGDPFHTVNAYFGKDKIEQIAKLQKGSTVAITCRGDGMFFMSPNLKCKQ